MSISAASLRRLAALSLSSEAMAEVLSIIADETDALPQQARSAGAERTKRWRERHGVTSQNVTKASHVTSHVPSQVTLDPITSDASRVGARAEPETTLSEENTETKEERKIEAPAARNDAAGELRSVLDPERAAAVVEHRKSLRKPLTPYAAKMLAKRLGAVPDPNAAADAMIANGWQGFEAAWLDSRDARAGPQRAGSGTGFNGKPTLGDIRNAALAAIAARDANGRPNLELLAGPERRPGAGNGDNRPADGVPRPSDGPDGDRGDLLRGLLRVRAFPG